ncbi:MAG: AbrB/MazE/SpoVT family DNA-binding domain-containing protein [Dehalococcoidia bacterium]|nr:AbrB/MazE/SpoVT family DNA-binding domain-containing protein [Dehalococcoidia bacterium]
MKARIQKWGNSLALRIPKSFAQEVGLESNAPVDILLEDRRLIVVPEAASQFVLEELLQQVTKDNLHGEIKTGVPVGKEIW